MFTLEHIQTAHSKVKTGADFPAYIKEIKNLGVTHYETFVMDGHTVYNGKNGYQISSAPRYDALDIADITNDQGFITQLKAHQQGKTDYYTFCKDAAQTGIEKWGVNMDKMTCTYYNKTGKEILVEQIPQ